MMPSLVSHDGPAQPSISKAIAVGCFERVAVPPEEVDGAVVLHLLAAGARQPDARMAAAVSLRSVSANVSTRPTADALSLAPAVNGVRSAWMHIAISSSAPTALRPVSGQIHAQPVSVPRR